ncbi:MAG: phosphohydrolase [Clostridia bacterium]|nr:phosphohydrolase [Clostridia bacterium]
MSNITTYYNHSFNPTTAILDDIDIRDIAHSLSLLCRAGGHIPHFYSVAQHCLNCLEEARARQYSSRVQLGCLLHDAGEAYLSDITRPVKKFLPKYREIENQLQTLIFGKWLSPNLTTEEIKQVFEIDDAMLYHEFLQLTGKQLFETAPSIQVTPDFSFADFEKIKEQYLSEFTSLVANLN